MPYLGYVYGIFSSSLSSEIFKFIKFENGKSEAGVDGAVVKATGAMNLRFQVQIKEVSGTMNFLVG